MSYLYLLMFIVSSAVIITFIIAISSVIFNILAGLIGGMGAMFILLFTFIALFLHFYIGN
jgi:hypothetical protein